MLIRLMVVWSVLHGGAARSAAARRDYADADANANADADAQSVGRCCSCC